ncbi:MAG: hypothetical protein ACKVOU_03870 [Cytophagales bacterium]
MKTGIIYFLLLISPSCFGQDVIQKFILDELNAYRTNPIKKCTEKYLIARDPQ